MWHTTVILHHENLPTMHDIKCINCGRLFFKINKRILVIVNSAGVMVAEIPTGVGYQEAKCRGCEIMYSIHWT